MGRAASGLGVLWVVIRVSPCDLGSSSIVMGEGVGVKDFAGLGVVDADGVPAGLSGGMLRLIPRRRR